MRKRKSKKNRASIEQKKVALDWATEYFRRDKGGLEKGIPDEVRGEVVDHAVFLHDSSGEKSPFASYPVTVPPEYVWALRATAAALLARDKSLPAPLADFSAAFLEDPDQFLSPTPGRKYTDSISRTVTIGLAVQYVSEKWGISWTRNRHSADAACAVSIAKEAVAAGANLHLSEAEIIRATRECQKLISFVWSFMSDEHRRSAEKQALEMSEGTDAGLGLHFLMLLIVVTVEIRHRLTPMKLRGLSRKPMEIRLRCRK